MSNRKLQICGHCGRDDVGSDAAGSAQVGEVYLCDPPGLGRPFCARLVTRFRHPMNCRCEERVNPSATSRREEKAAA